MASDLLPQEQQAFNDGEHSSDGTNGFWRCGNTMCSRRFSSDLPASNSRGAAGWTALHDALRAGIPYATQIVKILDMHALSFPWCPTFCTQGIELPCYRLIHRAWREGRLNLLLQLLKIWRGPDGKLHAACCRADFQQALYEFLSAHDRDGFQSLGKWLSEQALPQIAAESAATSSAAVRGRWDAIWEAYRHSHAA